MHSRGFVRRVAAGTMTALFAVILPSTLHAQRTLDITSFDADYVVSKAGQVMVTERITAHFTGAWNGLYRMIPIRYAMSNGTDYLIGLHVDDARDELGNVVRREETRDGAYLKIKAWIPDASDATHTLILKYTVDNGLRFFDEHDELYWNVTGNGWDYPIDYVTARVTLPAGATGIRTGAYTGIHGATAGNATASVGAAVARFETTQPLLMHEGLTIVVGWDRGIVARPTALSRALHFARSNALMLFPLLTLVLMYVLWRKLGKDPEIGTIAPRYEPPDRLSPAEVGTLIDMSVDERDIAATLVDLAVRGHIRINELPRGSALGISLGTEYTVERLTSVEEHNRLPEHERLMLKGLFASGHDLVSIDSLRNSFYTTLSDIKTTIYNGMMKAGYYKQDPQLVQLAYTGIGVIAFIAVYALGSHLAIRHGFGQYDIVAAAVLTGITIALFGFLMPRRTVRGVQMVRQALGFEEFLARVDGERMRTVIETPGMFEKYLPYAIALGVDEQWASRFEALSMTPPQWYTGSWNGSFHPNLFIHNVGAMTTSVNSTFSSAPRSSSGSGFSGGSSSSSSSGGGGGGSSGGGFGGGGGGGF